MSDFPPHYPPSTEVSENDPTYGWVPPLFPAQGPSETASNQVEGSAQPAAAAFTEQPLLNNKVAIPRLANSSAVSNRGRVSRACENCREQKVKCSGQRPTCQRCEDAGLQCSYGDRKREKLARRLGDLTARVGSLETLLQNIYPNLDSSSAQFVEQFLSDQYDEDRPSGHLPSESPLFILNTDTESPIGAIDSTKEDLNRDGKLRSVGFVGGHSEIAWMYKLRKALHQGPLSKDLDHDYITTANYFVDESDVMIFSDVDLSQRPLPAVADGLVESYFRIVHPCLPIISKAVFLSQYKSFYSSSSVRPGMRWLAVLNLIFAIAMVFARNTPKDIDISADNHTVYFSRAWKLSMGDITLLDHPDLQQVQVEGLSAFYLMIVGQANRAWRLSGISIQSAITMGLNLRNESSSILSDWRENRYRVWWSVYVLHVLLCVMTGRLPIPNEDTCTTPLPVPFAEEDFSRAEIKQLIEDHDARAFFMHKLVCQFSPQPIESALLPEAARNQSDEIASTAIQIVAPNASLHFLYFVDLASIMRRSIDALYAPGAGRKSWRSIETVISALNRRTDDWLARLPIELHFTQGSPACERERLSLAFAFYSTKILITQPCLSRILLQTTWDSQNEAFCTASAATCINTASQMLELLPDTRDLIWAYHLSPWWYSVHYIMQAITILLLSLIIREKANTMQYPMAIENISKATEWLAVLAAKDPSAQRAWTAIQDLFSDPSIKVAMEFSNRADT